MAYIGKSPTGTGVRSRYYYTATGSETSLSGADDNSNTLVFSDGNYVDVSLNGIALVAGTDYNTSTANTISGLSALSSGDIVEVVVYDIFTVADTVSAKDGGTFSSNVTVNGTMTATSFSGDGSALTGVSAGKVLQFEQFTSSTAVSGTTVIPDDDTVPTATEGVQIMTASFTPTSATSDIFILCNIFGNEHSNVVSTLAIPLFAGTTHLQTGYISARGGPGADGHTWGQTSFMTKHTPGSTATITYQVRGGCAGSSGTFESIGTATSITNSKFGNTILNTITIWEVST